MVTSNIRRYGRYRLVPKCGTCGYFTKPNEKGPPAICPECGEDHIELVPGRYFWTDKYVMGFRVGFSRAYFEPRGLGKVEKLIISKSSSPITLDQLLKSKGLIPVLRKHKTIGYYKGGAYEAEDNLVIPCTMVDDLDKQFLKDNKKWIFVVDKKKLLLTIVASN